MAISRCSAATGLQLAGISAGKYLLALFALALTTLILAAAPALAQNRTVLDLDADKQPVALADWGDYWIDPQARREVTQVAGNNVLNWQKTPLRGIYPLLPGQALWIRFIVPPAPDAERWMLEIPYPAVDRASLYTVDRSGQWTEQRSGDLTPNSRWPTPHRHPLLTLNFNAEEPTQYLLRIENAQGFSAPLRFVSARGVLRNEQKVSLFLGAYFGLALMGCVVGLLGMAWLRDRAYLYYGLCSALVGLMQATVTGVAALQLWPDSPQWTDRSLVLLATWMLMSLLLLNAAVVSLEQRSRALNAVVWGVLATGAGLSVALGLTDSAVRLTLIIPYLLLVPLVILAINMWAWQRGDRFGGWLLLSATPLAISLLLATARYREWLPQSFATELGILASMALQLPALLAVLILRSRQRRENIRRIRGLDRIDPSTGLINEAVFAERLMRMMARAERFRHQGAVLMIDLANTEQIQRDFGRRAAGELPLRIAARLLSTTREIDSAARLSDQRFGMLVEGPVSPEEAATLGPRIVARCLMPYRGLPEACVAQVRVAYALVPRQGPTAEIVLARLAQRLTNIPPESKRAVFMLPDYK